MTKIVTCIEFFRYALVPAPFTLHLLFLLLLFKRLRKTATLLKDYGKESNPNFLWMD
jgi:hypothetical protein